MPQGKGELNSLVIPDGITNQKPLVSISIIIVNHNSGDQLINCLRALEKLNYPCYEVIIVDNDSDDGSIEESEEKFPWIKVIKSTYNGGFGYANNLGARYASGDIYVFLNPDTEVNPGWLESLVSYYCEYPQASLIASKIVLLSNEKVINSAGNQIHFSGLSFCRGLGTSCDQYSYPEWTGSVSGAGFAVRRDIFEDIEGFDPLLFLYHDDVDFSLRCYLAGYHCLYAPEWIVKHDFTFNLPPEKWRLIEQNRLAVLLRIFHWPTFIFLSPFLIVVEFLIWGYLAMQGYKYFKGKFQSYIWVLTHLKEILLSRKKIQSYRRVSDNYLLRKLSVQIPVHQLLGGFSGELLSKALNSGFNSLFALIIMFIKW